MWLQSGELRIAEILQTDERTDGRTDERTDIRCLSNGRKNLITLKDQAKKCIKVLEKYAYGNQV